MCFLDVLDQIFNIGVFLFAEATMLLNFLMNSFNMDFEMAFAETGECTVIAAELLPRMFPHVNVKVGFDCTGVTAVRTLVRFFICVNPQMCLEGVFEFEHLVTVFTCKNLQLSWTQPKKKANQLYLQY